MKIKLQNEAGQTKEFQTSSIEEAAIWAVSEGVMDDYGCFLYPEDGEDFWDSNEWEMFLCEKALNY